MGCFIRIDAPRRTSGASRCVAAHFMCDVSVRGAEERQRCLELERQVAEERHRRLKLERRIAKLRLCLPGAIDRVRRM